MKKEHPVLKSGILVIHSAQVDTGDSLRAKFVIGGELTAR